LRRFDVTAYSVADAKNRLPRLIDKALAGEQVIITRRGKPVVELRPAARQAAPATGIHLDRRLAAAARELGVAVEVPTSD
jgi:prevent-host-death family protein